MELVREFISTVFVVNADKVLLTWNNKVQSWIPIGGHIEENELPCSSVIREAKEESGLHIELVSAHEKVLSQNLIQPAHVHLDHIREDHEHINLIYFARVKSGDCFSVDDEGKELRWFSRNDLMQEDMLSNVKEWALRSLDHVK